MWIEINQKDISTFPTVSGKYVVKTKTTMGNIHKLECNFNLKDNKGHFSVTNQIVTHWLKE